MDYIVVEGIKLFERECKVCVNRFRVPKSCPQLYCSEFCEQRDIGVKAVMQRKRGKKRKKLTYKIKRSDYERN